MVCKRSAKAVKRCKKVELVLQNLEAGVFTSVNCTVRAYAAGESTVRSKTEGNELQQLLSVNKEWTLVKWITEQLFP